MIERERETSTDSTTYLAHFRKFQVGTGGKSDANQIFRYIHNKFGQKSALGSKGVNNHWYIAIHILLVRRSPFHKKTFLHQVQRD
jgi:hypothetical protein